MMEHMKEPISFDQLREAYIESVKTLDYVYEQADDLEAARECLESALILLPDEEDFLINLGSVLRRLGLRREAERIGRRAVRLNPTEPDCHYLLGNIYRWSEKLEQAAASYKRVLRLCPDDIPSLNNLGLTLYDLERYEKAEAIIDRGLKLAPEDLDLISNRAWIYLKTDRLEQAATDFRKMIALDSSSSRAYYGLGTTLDLMGDNDGAEAAFETENQLNVLESLLSSGT